MQTINFQPADARFDAESLIDLAELSFVLKRSYASLRRDWMRGRIPQPTKLGRRLLWRRAEILATFGLTGEASELETIDAPEGELVPA